jgi:type I restriction enzyme, S subunit
MQLTVDNEQLIVRWKISTLDQLCENLDSKRVPITKSSRNSGDVPYYGASGIVDYVADYIFNGNLLLVSEDGANLLARTYPIAFSITGKTWVNNHAHVLRFTEETTQRFVEYYLNSISLEPYVSGMAQPKLNQKALNSIPIPIPPLLEQKRIVAIVDEAFESIDIAIENTKKNLTNTRELFENYRNSIFIQRNDGWEKKKLGDIATFRNGLNYTKDSKGKSIKIVGVKDFKNEFWVDETTLESVTIDEDLKEIDILRAGDILTVRSNGNKELIGRCIMAHELQEEMSHSGFTIRIRMERKDIHPPFIVHFLKSRELRKQLIESGGGINISSLNQQGLSLIMMSFPVLEKQKNIVKNIDNLAVETQRLEAIYQKKLAALTELKQSILQKAFTGELTADTTNQTTKKSKEVIAA